MGHGARVAHALLAHKAYFVSLDGFVFERGSQFFSPRFQDVKPQADAVEAVRSLAAAGHRIVYLSIRPQSLEDLTHVQMQQAALPPGSVLWNCPIANWTLLTSPHPTLPFATSRAIEIRPVLRIWLKPLRATGASDEPGFARQDSSACIPSCRILR